MSTEPEDQANWQASAHVDKARRRNVLPSAKYGLDTAVGGICGHASQPGHHSTTSRSSHPPRSPFLRRAVFLALSIELATALYHGYGTAKFSFLLQLAGACAVFTTLRAVYYSGPALPLLPLAVYSIWKVIEAGRVTLVDIPLAFSDIPPSRVNTSFIRLLADPEHRAAIVAYEMRECAFGSVFSYRLVICPFQI